MPTSQALIKQPASLDSTSFLTKVSTIEEIVDIVKEGICTPLMEKGLWREDRNGQGIRWLKVWSKAALIYLENELRKIALPVGKTGDNFVFAASELLEIKALLKELVKQTTPEKHQLQPKLPYPQAFPLLGIFPQRELSQYGATGKLSPVMALFTLFKIKRILYMNSTTYRDAVADTVAYARQAIDHFFSQLNHSVLSQWERKETTVDTQMKMLKDLDGISRYLRENQFREVETRSKRLARILDENKKFSKWHGKRFRDVSENPVPLLELSTLGKLLCDSESSHSLAHFVSQRRRDIYQV